MATVYSVKTGKPQECGKDDAKILLASKHFTKDKPKVKSEK